MLHGWARVVLNLFLVGAIPQRNAVKKEEVGEFNNSAVVVDKLTVFQTMVEKRNRRLEVRRMRSILKLTMHCDERAASHPFSQINTNERSKTEHPSKKSTNATRVCYVRITAEDGQADAPNRVPAETSKRSNHCISNNLLHGTKRSKGSAASEDTRH